jgi:hypothetical protein
MAEAPKHTRRWFRFSLGTMFLLVMVAAMPLGLVNRAVQQRQHALKDLRSRGAEIFQASDLRAQLMNNFNRHHVGPWRPTTLPLWRRCCGDEAVGRIILPSNLFSGNDIEDVKRIFSEAVVTH